MFKTTVSLITVPQTWFGLVRVSHSCQRRLSFFGHLCLFVMPTPVKTILELFRPAFGVLPKTGDAEPVDRGKPGWERLRTICARSISAWRREDGTLWTDRHGVNSWRLPSLFQRGRKRDIQAYLGRVVQRYSIYCVIVHTSLDVESGKQNALHRCTIRKLLFSVGQKVCSLIVAITLSSANKQS